LPEGRGGEQRRGGAKQRATKHHAFPSLVCRGRFTPAAIGREAI
jgi:hypothetical protein